MILSSFLYLPTFINEQQQQLCKMLRIVLLYYIFPSSILSYECSSTAVVLSVVIILFSTNEGQRRYIYIMGSWMVSIVLAIILNWLSVVLLCIL